MDLGFVGLGRMGFNMVRRLRLDDHRVVAWNRTYSVTQGLTEYGAEAVKSVEEMIATLQRPRAIWVMVPSGQVTEDQIDHLLALLDPGDVIIDGGNSNYKETMRRAEKVTTREMHFMDCGTSGGVWGLQVGYCLMIGGERGVFDRLEPIFKTLAPPDGYALMGPSGAGHFVKMVHNGIEYGMLQAYGEGFAILEKSPFDLDLYQVSHLWNQGSVVRSWLLELAERAFNDDPHLQNIRGYVEDSGEGRWTVQTAMELDVPAPIITLSLLQRFRSRENEEFSDQVVAALRKQFGGHAVKTQ